MSAIEHVLIVFIVGNAQVPMVKPGKYVVGFRYDCDATAQVWSNCADITIV